MAKTELQRTGSGGAIFIDDYLSETSENPVMNKAVYAAIANVEGEIPSVDENLSETSENPVMNKAVYAAIEALSGEIPTVPVAGNVAECEAVDVTGCVSSINAILSALKEAGLMEADPDEPDVPGE